MTQILETTIEYLQDYLKIVEKEDKKKGILLSGKVANLCQLINIYKNELEKSKESKGEN
jgi:hypothetical protein